MQLRYAFRLYPNTVQQAALAEAFGCARVVFNDAVRAREDARKGGQPFPKLGDLSKKLITQAKRTAGRAWLGEVSAVVLQQSLRDVEAAYRNFFASLNGTRKGRTVGVPRFKSRKDQRQSIRFTANARWKITGAGRLDLPKIGAVKVKWSRTLPATPTSVTVIKDAAGRFFASFVIDTDPAADAVRMPVTGNTVGIDLGLTHFAVLSDGTKIDSPRFLRRAEKKLKKAQRELSRKQKGSRNRAKARLQVARAHAKVADARREFHHQLSTQLISENQGIAVENLSVKGLARTRLAKSVHDAGWAQFIGMLEYKAERYGRTFIRIDRFEPTSQVCSTLYRLRHRPRPGHQRRTQHQTGRRTGGISLRSADKTRTRSGTARRSRKPRIPDRTPCRPAAQHPVREGQNPRPSGRGACQTPADHTWRNNVISGNHPASEPADPGKITADPQLTDPASADPLDYRPKSGSPALKAGLVTPDNGGRDYTSAATPSACRPDIGAFQVSSFDDASCAGTNLVTNGGFESGAKSPWTGSTSFTVGTATPHTGGYAAQLTGAHTSAEQLVTVQPNTTYVLSGWGRVDADRTQLAVGVKNFGGTETRVPLFTGTDWRGGAVSFRARAAPRRRCTATPGPEPGTAGATTSGW